MILGFLLFAAAAVRFFPDTPFARTLVKYLVELPMDAMRKLERRHIILVVILLCAGQSLAILGSAELALAYAVDMSVYYDLLICAWTGSALNSLRTSLSSLRLHLKRPARRGRGNQRQSRGPARTARTAQPANDDDDIGRAKAA
ncbi:hypothetical protein OMW55_03170 [Sphingomonas sp. BN140010]|uniref:Uncharacterized protein n=1 Tax=Sphingomonas arvum TaxID=2992113 RepID=A0ABT3JCK3_9SPHN|nr:hypothetical protein [Sphingomonas sp. BN140010]MCW3796806.1 hypothetical protein [Sphingomonas sp. BN140010]